jgi:hypothetical protein
VRPRSWYAHKAMTAHATHGLVQSTTALPQLLLYPLFPCIMQPIIPSTQSTSATMKMVAAHSLLYNGYRVFPRGVKRPGHDIDHPTQPSAKVKERVPLLTLWTSVASSRVNFAFSLYLHTPQHISNRVLINIVSQPKGCNPHQQWCQILKLHMVQCA